jgi:hypothetical protein
MMWMNEWGPLKAHLMIFYQELHVIFIWVLTSSSKSQSLDCLCRLRESWHVCRFCF